MSATEVMDEWLARRDASDRRSTLQEELGRLQRIANGTEALPPAENGPGAMPGLYGRIEAITKELAGLAS